MQAQEMRETKDREFQHLLTQQARDTQTDYNNLRSNQPQPSFQPSFQPDTTMFDLFSDHDDDFRHANIFKN